MLPPKIIHTDPDAATARLSNRIGPNVCPASKSPNPTVISGVSVKTALVDTGEVMVRAMNIVTK